MGHLTAEAKALLAKTVRGFREGKDDPNGGLLLRGLREQARSEYRLDIADIERADLAQAQRARRERLEAWLEEQARAELERQKAQGKVKNETAVLEESRERHLTEAIKLAGATLLNRLVVIMQLEAMGLVKPAVVTGGQESPGYREFRDDFGPELCKGDRDGYGFLLGLVYDELAVELPGVFGKVGITELFGVPVSTLRAVVEALNDEGLVSAWTDDTTLGWVYQYWNDPEREALDARIKKEKGAKAKVAPYEIASKTQMFTERYMVEWLLQNSLNQQWLAICERNEWVPEAEKDGTLDALEEKRAQWREKREKGEVTLDALMPIEGDQEQRWKYWVKQPALGIEGVPGSIREIRIFDPACGSGHFLVIAFDLLFAFYAEEARHRRESWKENEIVESILENNLFGLDLDPRAVQIAAAALHLKAKGVCKEARPRRMNLVASSLNLAALPVDDPARVALRAEVEAETGIPGALTDEIVEALTGADVWGSLLQVDKAVDETIYRYEQSVEKLVQESLLGDEAEIKRRASSVGKKITEQKTTLLSKLEYFLTRRTQNNDLGLRLRGEQLAAGVRFVRIVKGFTYDLVVGNPPYLGTSKLEDSTYVKHYYEKSKVDTYAAFLERGLQLAKPGGLSAMVTMRSWMFIKQYEDFRIWLDENKSIESIADLHFGAFTELKDVSVMMSVLRNLNASSKISVFVRPVQYKSIFRDTKQIERNISGLTSPYAIFSHSKKSFRVIESRPLIYWWDKAFLLRYAKTPKMQDQTAVRTGLQTSDNYRYLRCHWEVLSSNIQLIRAELLEKPDLTQRWFPYIKGSAGLRWFEPVSSILNWESNGLCLKCDIEQSYSSYTKNVRNEGYYFVAGISFSKIGSIFSARLHRVLSVFDLAGSSVFPEDLAGTVCLMNSRVGKSILESLNPTVNFQVGDVKRLPLFSVGETNKVVAQLETAFTTHETAREPSVEFQQPGPTCWPYAQAWAQRAVDRPAGEPLPTWEPEYEEAKPTGHISYAIGLALGRFPLQSATAESQNVEGHSSSAKPLQPLPSLPNGILYLSTYSTGRPTSPDSLSHTDDPNDPAAPIHQAWATHHSAITNKDLHTWLRLHFFPTVHLDLYEKRPIYFPLSSQNKNFVAHISIHRWQPNTLKTLLADYLTPDLRTLQGELNDLETAKTTAITTGNTQAKADTSDQQDRIRALHSELTAFIALVRQCAETGPTPTSATEPTPEAPTPYRMTLDDGVMINSAALWPLLHPQWSKPAKNSPKNWWHELTTAKGRKDYDWSHLAARYFPTRVDAKCQKDPSLAVAHGCFWQYHPAKAYEWELRLQDEIGPNFTIDETDSDTYRQQFESQHPDTIKELKAKESKRRERKYKKQNDSPLLKGMSAS